MSKISNPELSFFALPWNVPARITVWLEKLNLVHNPTKTARICHRHFEEKFLVVDPKYRIAPHLYPRVVYRLTPDAYPSKFAEKREAPERKHSLKRRKKQEKQEQEVFLPPRFLPCSISMLDLQYTILQLHRLIYACLHNNLSSLLGDKCR